MKSSIVPPCPDAEDAPQADDLGFTIEHTGGGDFVIWFTDNRYTPAERDEIAEAARNGAAAALARITGRRA